MQPQTYRCTSSNQGGRLLIYSDIISHIPNQIAIIIVNLYSNTAVGWALGLAFGQLIIILPAILKIKKLNQLSNVVDWRDRSVLKKALKFCIPIVATLFLQWGNNSFYRFAIGDLYSIDVLAGIAVGLAVSMSIFLFFSPCFCF